MTRVFRNAIRSVTVAATLVLAAPAATRATDFLRGDVNGDGVVSLADAQFLSKWLFANGDWPGCWNAADANDSSGPGGGLAVDIADVAAIISAWAGNSALPAPFPEVGADPTPNDPDSFFYIGPDGLIHPGGPECASYGGGSALDDPLAELAILDATAEGGAEGWVLLSVATSSSSPLSGIGAALEIDGQAVAGARRPQSRVPGGFGSYASAWGTETGLQFFLALSAIDLKEGRSLPAGTGVRVAEIPVCLRPGLPAGTYAISVASAEMVDDATNRRIEPRTAGATLTVLEDVDPGWSCDDVDPSPPSLNALYRLGTTRAAPGSVAAVPFSIRADALVQGYAYSIDFDEEVLEARSPAPVWERPDGEDFSFAIYEMNNENATPGNGGIDEGFVIGAVVFDFISPYVGLPANVETEVLRLQFLVRPETRASATELAFIPGGRGSGQPVPNRLCIDGVNITPDLAASFVFLAGGIDIVPDIIVFVRGNSNGDAAVDLSDSIATLSWLFTGGPAPHCLDAADSNDDGAVEITDAIFLLQHLFLGGPPPPPPYPDEGEDPTEDGLGCR